MRKHVTREAWSPESEHLCTLRRIQRAESRNRRTLSDFAKWLAEVRSLSPGTITVRIGSASTFVDAMTSCTGCSFASALRLITAQHIEDFFVEYGKCHGMSARRSMRSAMRLVLRFGASRGWVTRELIEAVPSLIGYRLSNLPRGISEEQLSQLLTTPWKQGQCPRRDRAIVLLLASYGVRRHQVSALQLADIDWHEKVITFAAHKGGKAVEHVLTEAVAQALVEYLREERPPSECPHIFLRHRRPHVRLGPEAISSLVQARMQRCGLPPLRPHVLRHAFATRLLRAGQPVKVIADLLGHRSLDAVAVYAKVDFSRLVEVAIEWPEVAS